MPAKKKKQKAKKTIKTDPRPVGRPPKFTSPEEVERIGMQYVGAQRKKKKPILITGLAIALDTTRKTLMEYERDPLFGNTIKRLKTFCENFAEERLFSSSIRAAGPIFALKNYDWTDKQEIDHKSDGKPLKMPSVIKVIQPTAGKDAG